MFSLALFAIFNTLIFNLKASWDVPEEVINYGEGEDFSEYMDPDGIDSRSTKEDYPNSRPSSEYGEYILANFSEESLDLKRIYGKQKSKKGEQGIKQKYEKVDEELSSPSDTLFG